MSASAAAPKAAGILVLRECPDLKDSTTVEIRRGRECRKEGRKELWTQKRDDGATVYGHTTPKRPTPS